MLIMLCRTSVIDRVLPTVRLSPHPGVYAVAHPRDTGGRVRTNKPAVGPGELYAPAPKAPKDHLGSVGNNATASRGHYSRSDPQSCFDTPAFHDQIAHLDLTGILPGLQAAIGHRHCRAITAWPQLPRLLSRRSRTRTEISIGEPWKPNSSRSRRSMN